MTAPTQTIELDPNLFYRNLPGYDLRSLHDRLSEEAPGLRTDEVSPGRIDMNFEGADPHFVLAGHSVPFSEDGVVALGAFLRVPSSFLKRYMDAAGVAAVPSVFEPFLARLEESAVRVTYSDRGIKEVCKLGTLDIQPIRLVDIVARVVGTPHAEVVRLVDDPDEFAFDVRVPENHDRGVGGAPEVGDITSGGVRVTLDRKRHLAPQTMPFTYRLVCTNGQTGLHAGLRVEGRQRGSVDDVLADFEAMADRAFRRTEALIEGHYKLREQRVDNPERALRAIAEEQEIADRHLLALQRLAATSALRDEPTMFDVVNLVTNYANSPDVINDGGRRALEAAGGAVAADEAHRCGHCKQRVLV